MYHHYLHDLCVSCIEISMWNKTVKLKHIELIITHKLNAKFLKSKMSHCVTLPILILNIEKGRWDSIHNKPNCVQKTFM